MNHSDRHENTALSSVPQGITDLQEPATQPAKKQQSYETPARQLQDAQQQFLKEQADVDHHSKLRDAMKGKVALLQKAVTEIQQVVDAYGQVQSTLQKDKSDLASFSEIKSRMVACALDEDQKAKIDAKIADFDKKIEAQKTLLNELRTKAGLANQDHIAAQGDVEKAGSHYDETKAYPITLQESLQKLKAQRKAVDEQAAQGRTDKMYVLLGLMQQLLATVVIKSKVDYEADLNHAWNVLHAAKRSEKEKKKAWEDALAAMEKAQSDLKSLEGQRIPSLFKSLDEGNVSKARPAA